METKLPLTQVVSVSPDIMSGTPVFAGTRVPVQTLLDYLKAGDSIGDFLEGFPTVKREQVIAFLEEAKDRVLAAV
jgi:uncharacterized protein (DUF433 family)